MKKSFFVLILTVSTILFYSCGSTQTVSEAHNPAETEAVSQADTPDSVDEAAVSPAETNSTQNQDEITETVEEITETTEATPQEDVSPSNEQNLEHSESPVSETEAATEESPVVLELIEEDELLPPEEYEEIVVETENLEEPEVIDTRDAVNADVTQAQNPSEGVVPLTNETRASQGLVSVTSENVANPAQDPESKNVTNQSSQLISSNQVSQTTGNTNPNQNTQNESVPKEVETNQAQVSPSEEEENSSVSQSEEINDDTGLSPRVTENDEIGTGEIQPENEEETEEIEEVTPSRSVTVKKNQYLDITYPGNGWVYLGESQDPKLLTYFGRKLGSGDTTFTLRSRNSGDTLLHFYKNDALTGTFIDDYLAVTVSDEVSKSNEHAVAPSYAEIVPPKPSRIRGPEENAPKKTVVAKAVTTKELSSQTQKNSEKSDSTPSKSTAVLPPVSTPEENDAKTVIQTTGSNETNQSPSDTNVTTGSRAEKPVIVEEENSNTNSNLSLLDQAKQDYEAKRYSQALSKIQSYLESAASRIDEALYVQGQILEAESDVRDIRSAIDSYDYLTKNYPASQWWQNANKRSIYLKRFYIDIR